MGISGWDGRGAQTGPAGRRNRQSRAGGLDGASGARHCPAAPRNRTQHRHALFAAGPKGDAPLEKPSSSAGTPIEEPITLPPLADQKDLAERMAVAERLARTISHDLNNVFQSLLVNLQFAENGAHGMPSVVSDIRDAQQTTERALALAK